MTLFVYKLASIDDLVNDCRSETSFVKDAEPVDFPIHDVATVPEAPPPVTEPPVPVRPEPVCNSLPRVIVGVVIVAVG